jgi:glycerol kinase
MGDSHAALFGNECWKPQMAKVTYGTGSSVMMNVGQSPVFSDKGIVTSLAWKTSGEVYYVLEGNINYTGAVIKWLEEDLGLIASSKEVSSLAKSAGDTGGLYLVPAFSGLGAPYWKGDAKAMLYGMTRNTGKAEIVRAAEECIAYQIADIVKLMEAETRVKISELKVDGGPTRDGFLMQFQSDIIDAKVKAPNIEELSGLGPAIAAGIAIGIYDKDSVFKRSLRSDYIPKMENEKRKNLYDGWKAAVQMVLNA